MCSQSPRRSFRLSEVVISPIIFKEETSWHAKKMKSCIFNSQRSKSSKRSVLLNSIYKSSTAFNCIDLRGDVKPKVQLTTLKPNSSRLRVGLVIVEDATVQYGIEAQMSQSSTVHFGLSSLNQTLSNVL